MSGDSNTTPWGRKESNVHEQRWDDKTLFRLLESIRDNNTHMIPGLKSDLIFTINGWLLLTSSRYTKTKGLGWLSQPILRPSIPYIHEFSISVVIPFDMEVNQRRGYMVLRSHGLSKKIMCRKKQSNNAIVNKCGESWKGSIFQRQCNQIQEYEKAVYIQRHMFLQFRAI